MHGNYEINSSHTHEIEVNTMKMKRTKQTEKKRVFLINPLLDGKLLFNAVVRFIAAMVRVIDKGASLLSLFPFFVE